MRQVLLALTPGAAVLCWQLGLGIVVNLIIASVTALATEAVLLKCRQVPVLPTLSDHSALLSACLLALALPPYLPWTVTVVATIAAIMLGKQVYGGFGNNLFNPAMVGYAVAIVAFPLAMTAWPNNELLIHRFDGSTTFKLMFLSDTQLALSGATPLSVWRSNLSPDTANVNWHWANLAFLAGGLWLLYQKIITWHIPLMMLSGVVLGALLLSAISNTAPSVLFQLSNGAVVLGAFFIATDPVTAPKSKIAMGIFGLSIGVLLITFRFGSSYIDGLAFAVLIMNMFKPLLDRYFKVA